MLPSGSTIFTDEKELPMGEPEARLPGVPSASQQSWGVVISIVIIVSMIIIGAFYAWGERIATERAITAPQTEL